MRIIDAENTNGRMMDEANFYQVMPPLAEEEYQALKADIAERGVVVPVVLDGAGSVIDGHHRIRAWGELREEGRDVPDYPRITRSDLRTEAEKREEAWRLNMQRRHLSQLQKREAVAAKLKETSEWADNRVAALLGVDSKTVRSVRTTLESDKAIPRMEKLVGVDGKEYPRQRAVPTEITRERHEGPLAQTNPAGKALDKDKSPQKEPTVAEILQANPEMASELGEMVRTLAMDHKAEDLLRHARSALTRAVLHFSKASPEDVARYVLSDDAAEKAREAVRPTRSGPISGAEVEEGQAREAISWLERYIKALEEGRRPGLREVK